MKKQNISYDSVRQKLRDKIKQIQPILTYLASFRTNTPSIKENKNQVTTIKKQ
ncbi:MAG: hypothetical protein JW787_11565 [Sedimentisphaerales bacterium]|nr:hypothetical protein [Sedimentisphaerales bacterium]